MISNINKRDPRLESCTLDPKNSNALKFNIFSWEFDVENMLSMVGNFTELTFQRHAACFSIQIIATIHCWNFLGPRHTKLFRLYSRFLKDAPNCENNVQKHFLPQSCYMRTF